MIQFFKITLIVYSVFVTGLIGHSQNKKDLVIDRFSKNNFKTLTKGDWFSFTDKGDGGESTIVTKYEKDGQGNQFYGFTYTLQKGHYPWVPFAAMACHVSGKQMPAGVQAISYQFKGNEHSFILHSDNVKDFAFYQKVIPASKEWTTVIIPLTSLRQPKWGKKVSFNEQEMNALCWQVIGTSNDSGKVAIDDVQLLYTPQHVINKSTDYNTLSIGDNEIFHSTLLNEDRGLSIYLPAPLIEMKSSNKTYPVVYLLDGDAHIKSVGSMVQQLSPSYGNWILPDMIVIGIHNTNRMRDLSPSHISSSPYGHNNQSLADTGGGEKFMDFVEKELIPHIDSMYPTAPYRILIGHSLGGLTTIHTLIHRPYLFNAYLAIDPSLWWNDQLLNKQAEASLDTLKLSNKQLFIAMANTMYAGVDTNKVKTDTSIVSLHMRSMFEFKTILNKHTGSGLRWKNVYYAEDDHMSVPLVAEYDGLRYFFDFNRITFTGQIDDPNFNIDSAFTSHYKMISEKMGYLVLPPQDMINRWGTYYLNSSKTWKQALAFFQMNVKNYPKSGIAYRNLGDCYEKIGDTNNAMENYKKALAISEFPMVRKKLEKFEALK